MEFARFALMNMVYIGEKYFAKIPVLSVRHVHQREEVNRLGPTARGGSGLEEAGWPVGTACPAGRPWEVVPRCAVLGKPARTPSVSGKLHFESGCSMAF